MMNTLTLEPTTGNMLASVLETFAEVTRYPLDILDENANLEEDLGIDSVKLGEVFSVLREKFGLPEHIGIPPEQLQTILGIATALSDFLGKPAPASASEAISAAVAQQAAVPAPAIATSGNLFEEILQVFAEVTRYPADILDPEANLEEDLGIDSVKLGEVFSVLREKYGLPEHIGIPPEQLTTIGGISAALADFLGEGVAPDSTVPEPVPTTVVPAVAAPTIAVPTAGIHQVILEVFAEVTRYPVEILDPEANLEEDLGIDSVKLGEVFSVLREKYGLPEHIGLAPEQLRTIGSISTALANYLEGHVPAPATKPYVEPELREQISNAHTVHHAHSNGFDVASTPHNIPVSYRVNERPFEGKVAFVSGSGRGLGKDISSYLANLGATVIINSFHSRERGEATAQEIVEQGGNAMHIWGSMANPKHVDAVFDEIESRYGGLDFFIGNASNGMLAKLEDLTIEHWEKAFRTNIVGLHQSAMRAVNLMKKRGGGKIITLSSPASQGYVDYFGCMGTVKAAVESLTRSLAIEMAQYNIQVNCVSPGPIYGELLNKWPESERLIKQWEGNTAYDRLCEARDVSHFISYLLGDDVKLFTGSVLVMDGGISSQGW